jgi:Starch binding domain
MSRGIETATIRVLIIEQGQNIYLVGNTSLFGGAVNNPDTVILPMNPGRITPSRPEWYIDIYLPAGIPVEYQYVLQQPNGSLIFDNVTYVVDVSPCGGPIVMTEETFAASG